MDWMQAWTWLAEHPDEPNNIIADKFGITEPQATILILRWAMNARTAFEHQWNTYFKPK